MTTDNILFLFAKQTNPIPNQSNRRSTVLWYFPFSIPCLDQIQPQSVPTRTCPFASDSKRALRRLPLCRASSTSNVATPIYRLITLFCVEFGSINCVRFHFLSVKATLIEFDIVNKVSSQLLTCGLYHKTITIINDDHKLRHNLEHHLWS